MGRWLHVLKEEARKGFHPELPKYGFGDPTSYGLIGDIVSATISHGAVSRKGLSASVPSGARASSHCSPALPA